MEITKLVTVYIATHNRAGLLTKAISSVLRQTYHNIEIIVADDASSDNTEMVVASLMENHPQIKYIRSDSHRGANYARNQAILAAKGYYVTGLDDDDEMLPERVGRLVNAYDEQDAFVSSTYYIRDGRKLKHRQLTFRRYINLNDLLYANIVGNQVLTTKEKLIDAGMFDENLVAGQDIDMWIRLIEINYKAKILHMPLQIVNVGHSSITLSTKKRKGYLQVYAKYKPSMNTDQKKYRLLGMCLTEPKRHSFFKIMKLLPMQPKYLLFSLAKMIKYTARKEKEV